MAPALSAVTVALAVCRQQHPFYAQGGLSAGLPCAHPGAGATAGCAGWPHTGGAGAAGCAGAGAPGGVQAGAAVVAPGGAHAGAAAGATAGGAGGAGAAADFPGILPLMSFTPKTLEYVGLLACGPIVAMNGML